MGVNITNWRRQVLLRVVVWLVILVAPSAWWVLFTSDGHEAWHMLFAQDAHPRNRPVASANIAPTNVGLPPTHGIALIPAVRPPAHPELQVQLYANQTTGLVLVDPKGRHSGIVWRTLGKLREIPHSHVRRMLIGKAGGAKHELVTVTVNPASSFIYTLAITAKRPGEFRLSVAGVSRALNGTKDFVSDRVPAATRLHYRINLNNIHPPSPFASTNRARRVIIKPSDEFVAQTKSEVIESTDQAVLAAAAAVTKDPCGYFYKKLKGIPHERFVRSDGEIKWFWNSKTYRGCQVVLVTTDRLLGRKGVPSFTAFEGTYLYKLGWRMDNALAADGPGSTDFGIENRTVLCSVSRAQPGEIDPKTNKYIQSKTLTVTIQCRHR